MEIKLFNTLTRNKEIFTPLKKGAVSIYNCGPTVYDVPHIGNYRTFVMDDIIRRVFEYNKYKVLQVVNITDVDDKTIRKSREQKVPLQEVTRKYEDLFIDGLESLNILKPQRLIRATENIQYMIDLIEVLLKKSIAYKAADGVYVSISKVSDYGKLAILSIKLEDSGQSHHRIANDEYDKENPRDFAVWKFKTDEDANISWSTSFGEGRPGWHIECSAMALHELGSTVDIHTGGSDLIFPHHTNEIAQSESATGKRFVNYWIHGGFMNVAEEKMAKSKGNFIKLEQLSEEDIAPLSFRYWLLTAHYRSPVNFTFEAVKGAQNALIRLMEAISTMDEGGSLIEGYKERFLTAINDDLDMPKAISLVWEILKDASAKDADKRATILDFDTVLGLKLGSVEKIGGVEEVKDIPLEIQALVDAREDARRAKDWVKADALRSEIEERGFAVVDTESGVKIFEK